MITLYTFGLAFGLPDPSPFVMKAEVLLKMAGLAYVCKPGGPNKAPKGKLPFLNDDGTMVADSSFIRFHLEDRHGIDFDAGLDAAQKGAAWAVEKLCEDTLYWSLVRERWLDPPTFDRGARRFFDPVPAPLRPAIVALVRRKVRRDLKGQGLGRHSTEDMLRLASRAIDAVSDVLGDKPWLMGEKPCGADASVFATVASLLSNGLPTRLEPLARKHANLIAYRDRGMARWYGG